MPRPARIDSYGRPLPELAEVHQEVLHDRPTNQAQRRLIGRVLDECYRQLLRRGVYGEVCVRFVIQDGVIHPDVHLGMERRWRGEAEDERAR